MLGGIGDEIFNAAHDVIEKDTSVDESAEAGNLASNRGSDFGFVVFKKLDECRDEISRNDLFIDGLGNLFGSTY